MFKLEGSMKFVNIDTDYVRALHDVCDEVFFSSRGYENKPYIGVLVENNGIKYAIPLTSAKIKHTKWRDIDEDRMLVYERVKKSQLSTNDIYKPIPNSKDDVKHILSAIDIKKMIPVRDDVIHNVDLNPLPADDNEMKKYKDLENKEYSHCIKLKNEILQKADKIYNKQKETGKVNMFCVDFSKVEQACKDYNIYK